ncbi:MAG TPA: hypothetical protein VMA98_11670 [Candidatus Acidoferrales bacterium]|nr:hypothetical protein [Candidatus Acidoferrales bacterium]
MAEYLTNALAFPDHLHATESSMQAQVLARVSYEIARARAAVSPSNNEAVLSALGTAARIVAEALRPLARTHAEELRSLDRRRAGGWSG